MPNGEKNTFREEDVIGGLLRSSKFSVFYAMEKGKINRPLHWALDPDLPEGIRAQHVIFPGGKEFAICLRQVPAWLKDACVVAHELGHNILVTECFPLIEPNQKDFRHLVAALGSMLQDPIINQKLLAYGFNVQEQYEAEVRDNIQNLKGRSSPSTHFNRAEWIFTYVGKILEWETAYDQVGDNEYQSWFDAKYPKIAQDGQELLNLVHDVGYDTPEKQTVLLKKIIQQHNIANVVVLHDHQGATCFGGDNV